MQCFVIVRRVELSIYSYYNIITDMKSVYIATITTILFTARFVTLDASHSAGKLLLLLLLLVFIEAAANACSRTRTHSHQTGIPITMPAI